MRFEADRFSAKQVNAPETILGVTQHGKPGRAIVGARRLEVLFEDSANHILVEVDTEGIGNLFGDARAAAPGIATLELEDGLNNFRTRALGSRFAARLGGEGFRR